jgi:hypothetical protein
MLQQVRFFDSERKNPPFADAKKLHKISDARSALTTHRPNLTDSKIEFRYQGALLNDTDLIPRPPRVPIIELEFRVFPTSLISIPLREYRKKLFHFDDGSTVETALRHLAVHFRVPHPVLSLELDGRILRENDPLLTSIVVSLRCSHPRFPLCVR